MALTLTSAAFKYNGAIPALYTCQGKDVSVPLAWSGVPAGAKSLVLIVDDPDAPDPKAPRMTWVHWVLYNLPATATGKVSASIIYEGPIKAPIRKGDRIAVLRVTSAEAQATNDIALYAGDNIDQSNFAMRGIDSLLVLAFGWLL